MLSVHRRGKVLAFAYQNVFFCMKCLISISICIGGALRTIVFGGQRVGVSNVVRPYIRLRLRNHVI